MSDQTLGFVRDTDVAPEVRIVTRRRAMLAGAVLLIAAIGWYGTHWWQVGRFIESTDDAYVGGEVTVLAPRIAGLITTVAVTDNQAVHAGDLLVRIDDRDFRASLAGAEARVAGAEATLQNIAARHRLQLAVIAENQAALPSTAAEIARTKLEYDRYQSLSHDQFGTRQRFEAADADLKKAVAQDVRARASLDAASAQLDVLDTEAAQARAARENAIADRDTARLNLGYTELRAPVDGTIGNRSARVGTYAGIGAQLLSLVPADGLWVDANFKEDQLAAMHPGLPVAITADALPGRVLHGHLLSLAPATGAQFSVLPAENATGNFTKIVQRVPVRVKLDGDDSRLGLLRPGLSVTAAVDER